MGFLSGKLHRMVRVLHTIVLSEIAQMIHRLGWDDADRTAMAGDILDQLGPHMVLTEDEQAAFMQQVKSPSKNP